MIYLIYGNQSFMLKNRLQKVKKEVFDDEEENIIKINLNEQKPGALIDEINQMGLGFSKKLIIVYDSDFFTESKKKAKSDAKTAKKTTKAKKNDSSEDYEEELIRALEEIDEDTSVVFMVETSEISKERALYKYISENGSIFELKELSKSDWPMYIKQYFAKREVKISDEAVEELVKRINGDVYSFNNEASKLLMYAEDKKIELEDIEELVPESLDDDAFKILNGLIEGNKDLALKVYRDLRVKNVEPMTLINLMASNLIYMLNVKLFLEQGAPNDIIAQKTGSTTGRVFVTSKNVRKLKREFISEKINQLYELERAIKHSEVDRFIAFEMYLLSF